MRRDWSSSSPRDRAAAQGRSGSAGSQCANRRTQTRIGPSACPSDRPGADAAFAVDGQLATAWRSDPEESGKPHADFRRGANSAALSCIGREFRVALRGADDGAQADTAQRERWQRRQRCAGAAGSRESLPRLPLQDGPCRDYGRSGRSRIRFRRIGERVHRSGRAQLAARLFPPRLFRGAGLLDVGRHRWWKRQRAVVDRRRARGRAGRFLDRAVCRRPRQADHLGRGRPASVPARRLFADARCAMAAAAVGAQRIVVRIGSARIVVASRPVRNHQYDRGPAAAGARARHQAFPGNPPTRPRHWQRDSRHRLGRNGVHRQRPAQGLRAAAARQDRRVLFRPRGATQAAGAFGLGRGESRP